MSLLLIILPNILCTIPVQKPLIEQKTQKELEKQTSSFHIFQTCILFNN